MEKCSTGGQATNDDMEHPHFTLGTRGYKHTQYVLLISFTLQKWLHEHVSVLRYTYSTLPALLNYKLPKFEIIFNPPQSSQMLRAVSWLKFEI